MPAIPPGPRDLDAWLTLLQPLQPPVDPALRSVALTELQSGRGSATTLAPLLLDDPAMSMRLLGAANQALARYDRAAHTLEHAISLLGVSRVQKLIETAVPLDPAHPHALEYRQALLRSRHAAWQARLWAEGGGRWPSEEVFWSALLAGAPMWLLWLEAGPALRELEQLRARGETPRGASQTQVLGCSLQTLGAALAKAWHLPEMSQLSWLPSAAGTPRQWVGLQHAARLEAPPVVPDGPLNELCHHPALVVAVANVLAEEADWNWQSKSCERLLSIAASACRRPLSTLVTNTHQTAAELSRHAVASGLLTPAARLLGFWRQDRFWQPEPRPKRNAAALQRETQTNAAANAREQLLQATLKRLSQPTAVDSPSSVLALTIDALHRGLELQRVAVLLYRAGSKELHASASIGAEQVAALGQFRHQVAPNSLFAQLLVKPVCLHLQAANRAKFWPHLPELFRQAIDCDNFVLMSVFAGSRPIGLIYADCQANPEGPSAQQQQRFKHVCQQLSACLTQLGGRTKT